MSFRSNLLRALQAANFKVSTFQKINNELDTALGHQSLEKNLQEAAGASTCVELH